MILKINGEKKEFKDGITLENIIEIYNLQNIPFVFELNLNIIQKSDCASIILKEGDSLEIVSLCGGG